ncbi:DUF6110 family protein [Peptoniphilus sp. GNH]|nr:hypothetical protein HMPREF3189_00493 [Clostridiales bacterium KA00134]UHR02544.1 DUF6110 family protein [Peptoniphilus sp. GNH]
MKKRLLGIGAGVVLGFLGEQIIKSNAVKKLAVSTVAGGLKVKEGIDKTIEKVKENAEDIVAEAKVKKAEEAKAKVAEESVENLAEEEIL